MCDETAILEGVEKDFYDQWKAFFFPKNVFWKNFSFMISLESIVIYSLEWNYNFLNKYQMKYYGLKYDIVEIYRYFGLPQVDPTSSRVSKRVERPLWVAKQPSERVDFTISRVFLTSLFRSGNGRASEP